MHKVPIVFHPYYDVKVVSGGRFPIQKYLYLKKLLEKDGYTKGQILEIFSLIKKAEFKRKQAPPILKLSSQSLGIDWRVPIAIFN